MVSIQIDKKFSTNAGALRDKNDAPGPVPGEKRRGIYTGSA
jgi:hypothetical protein